MTIHAIAELPSQSEGHWSKQLSKRTWQRKHRTRLIIMFSTRTALSPPTTPRRHPGPLLPKPTRPRRLFIANEWSPLPPLVDTQLAGLSPGGTLPTAGPPARAAVEKSTEPRLSLFLLFLLPRALAPEPTFPPSRLGGLRPSFGPPTIGILIFRLVLVWVLALVFPGVPRESLTIRKKRFRAGSKTYPGSGGGGGRGGGADVVARAVAGADGCCDGVGNDCCEALARWASNAARIWGAVSCVRGSEAETVARTR